MNIEDAVVELLDDTEYTRPWSTDADAAAWLMHTENLISAGERAAWELEGVTRYGQNLYDVSVSHECLREAYTAWRNGGQISGEWVRSVMADAFAMYDPHASAFNVWEMLDNPDRYGTPLALFEAMMRLSDGVEPTELW